MQRQKIKQNRAQRETKERNEGGKRQLHTGRKVPKRSLLFDLQHSQSYELTLESDKDSIGHSKEVVYHRIRDGDSETIRVQGGKVTLRTIDNLSKSLHKADTTLVINNQISQKTETKKPNT